MSLDIGQGDRKAEILRRSAVVQTILDEASLDPVLTDMGETFVEFEIRTIHQPTDSIMRTLWSKWPDVTRVWMSIASDRQTKALGVHFREEFQT